MNNPSKEMKSIDEYINEYSGDIKKRLIEFRKTIKSAAPKASETIKYRMPTFVLNGNLVHFAAFNNHIGFFPTPSGIEPFKKELSKYVTSKGGIQFPHSKPIPYDLVKRIVEFRIQENLKK